MSGSQLWPPTGPTTLASAPPSYLYQQYSDDDDLQAFVAVFNAMAQQYVDWFNTINLPVYTGTVIIGALLDWVVTGLYGLLRPSLPSGISKVIGPFNSYQFNAALFNEWKTSGVVNYYQTTDDIYKRILTWHFYKGDGKVFNVRWLKRRIMRLLIGVNGTAPNIDQTYQISVTFGTGNQVDIRIIDSVRTVTGGALFNRFRFNRSAFNGLQSSVQQLTPIADAAILQSAVQSGALELPFQFSWVVIIQATPSQTGLLNVGGVLTLVSVSGYPTSATGLATGAVWSNSLAVNVVPGMTPNPSAPPVYFGQIAAAALLSLGGGNLPLSNPGVGTLQLWNNGGVVNVA